MLVGVDFDGVIVDSGKKICDAVRQVYGVRIRPADISCYNLCESLGVPSDENSQLGRKAFDLNSLEFLHGAESGMHDLQQCGHEIVVITRRGDIDAVRAWLNERNLFVDVLHWGGRWATIPRVDFMLDDYPVKLVELLPYINEWGYLLTQPWNKNCSNIQSEFKRVACWHDFVKEITRTRQTCGRLLKVKEAIFGTV